MNINNKLKSKLLIFKWHIIRNKSLTAYVFAMCLFGFIVPA